MSAEINRMKMSNFSLVAQMVASRSGERQILSKQLTPDLRPEYRP